MKGIFWHYIVISCGYNYVQCFLQIWHDNSIGISRTSLSKKERRKEE